MKRSEARWKVALQLDSQIIALKAQLLETELADRSLLTCAALAPSRLEMTLWRVQQRMFIQGSDALG